MKSLKYLFLIAVALFSTAAFFSSCSNEDDDLEGSNNIEKFIIITQMIVRLPASHNDIYTSIGKELIVKSGKTQITKLTNERATVRFSKFVVQLGETTMNIEGSGSCEIK